MSKSTTSSGAGTPASRSSGPSGTSIPPPAPPPFTPEQPNWLNRRYTLTPTTTPPAHLASSGGPTPTTAASHTGTVICSHIHVFREGHVRALATPTRAGMPRMGDQGNNTARSNAMLSPPSYGEHYQGHLSACPRQFTPTRANHGLSRCLLNPLPD